MNDKNGCNDPRMLEFMSSSKEKLETIHSDIVELKSRVGIQNGRIFKIEKWQAFIYGGCALMGVIMTLASTISILHGH